MRIVDLIPSKIVESDRVTRARLRYEALSPTRKKVADAAQYAGGAALGLALFAVSINVAAKILENENTED